MSILDPIGVDRRAVMAGVLGLGLVGCGRASPAAAERSEAPGLKSIALRLWDAAQRAPNWPIRSS